jgi:hypothetical protein
MLNYFFLAKAQNYFYDLTYQKLELWLDPSQQYISGNVVINGKLLEPSLQISFDLAKELNIDSILADNQQVSFSREQNRVDVLFDTMMQSNFSITIYYNGVPPQSQFGSFTVDTHDGVPVLWTLSEPYGAKDWFPTKNNLGDKIDSIELILHVPSQYYAASNGVLLKDTVIDDMRIMHWKSNYPIASYLVAIGVTNYFVSTYDAVIADSVHVPFMMFVYPEDSDMAYNFAQYSEAFMDLYSKGYSRSTQINSITEPEYDFLHKPILDDVLNQIDIWAKKSEFSDFEKAELENLGAKMSSLKNLDFLAFHSNMKPTTEKFTHIDFDEIKDDPVSFSIIYWLIVKEWIAIMKETAKRDFKNKVTKPK